MHPVDTLHAMRSFRRVHGTKLNVALVGEHDSEVHRRYLVLEVFDQGYILLLRARAIAWVSGVARVIATALGIVGTVVRVVVAIGSSARSIVWLIVSVIGVDVMR